MSQVVSMSSEEASRRVDLLKTAFFTRTDFVAAFMPWGKPHPIEATDHLDALLLAHVMGSAAPKAVARYSNRKGGTKVEKGHYRIGSYTPDSKGLTKWLCLDFDGDGHADGLVDPKAALIEALHACQGMGIRVHIEQSGGGKGWHLWVVFSEPVKAKDVRALALFIVPKDQPLVSGRLADARVNRGIEVFPKQDRIRKKRGFGNLVWLPLWSGAPTGANRFYELEDGELQQYDPEVLETVSPETLAEALKSVDAAKLTDPQKRVTDASLSSPSDRAVLDQEAVREFLNRVDKNDAGSSPPSDDWRLWRETALASFPLDAVYGDWLTGEYSGENWLQCRDPDSPSGDQDPSAGVADGNGDAPRGTFHSFRTQTNTSVFDFMVQRGQATDFSDALKRVASLSGVPLPARTTAKSESSSRSSRKTGYPIIVVNARQLRDILWDARGVVNAANGQRPFLFRRSGRPVRLVMAGGNPQIEYVDDTVMYGILARLADWVRRTDEGDFDAMPPHSVAKDLVASTDPSLPPLDAVVSAPVFDSTGTLVVQPGYHRDSGIWYHEPPGFVLPPVPDDPSDSDLDHARALLLDECLVDFPFVSESDRTHAIAAFILPFVRRLVSGPTPIHLYEAPTPGTGKTLLAEITSLVATSSNADPITLGRDDEEVRKKITSLLALGRPVVLIDNVRAGMDSANLAAALTAETWQDRLLGRNEMTLLPNKAVWLVTANNPNLSLEIARRSIRIRIEPAEERPWQRDNFKHSPLKEWVRAHRPELVWAVLVLVQVWQAAGCPPGTRTLGSFEQWSAVVGGILGTAGIHGFLENADELYEAADLDGQEWRVFAETWWDEHGSTPVAVKYLLELAQQNDMLGLTIGSKSERSQAIRIGKALAANRNRRFGSYRIETARISHNQKLWKLTELADVEEETAGDDSERGMLLPFQRDIPPNIPPRNSSETLQKGDVENTHPPLSTTSPSKHRVDLAHLENGPEEVGE